MTQLEPAFEGLLQQTMPPGNTSTGPLHNPGLQQTASTTIPGLQQNLMTSFTNTPSNSGLQTSLAVTSLVHPFSGAPSTSTTNHQTTMAAGPGSVATKPAVESLDSGAEITSQQVNTIESEAVTDATGTTATLHGSQQPGFSGYVEGERSPLEQAGPPAKKAKVMMSDLSDGGGGGGGGFFPTDQDIDDFLDKLHRDSNSTDNDSD